MYGTSNKPMVLLLPKLKADSDVKGDLAGEWSLQPSKAFNDVATSLDYQAPGAIKNISSVPTMWARPLTLEMVLYDGSHPLRSQMAEQWQGMLAAIALAEVRGFPLKAELVELGSLKGESFADSLLELLPEYRGRNLYRLDNKHPWQDIYVFLWDKRPVGMTSPSTLVVPSEEGVWEGLPWWNAQEKRLKAPQPFLNKEEQALLWGWLKNLAQELNKHQGDRNALNVIKGLIGEFQSILQENPELTVSFSDDPQFFGVSLNRGALVALNYPVKLPERPSSVRLIPNRQKEGKKLPLLIYDPQMATEWNQNPQNIWIHGGKTLASLKPQDLRTFKERWRTEVILLSSDELFLPELQFIDLENALPGGLFPPENEPLIFNNRRITPLISLNPILLDYFTPEDLVSKIKFQPVRTGEGVQVRLIVDLPLSGVRTDKASENYRLYKDYQLKEENSLGDQLPVLQLWPTFKAKGWQEYYGFYYDAELGEATFQVKFPDSRQSYPFQEGPGNYQMDRLASFPEWISCLNSDKNLIGIILLKSPETVQLNGTWIVGVDFGTSFTNIYIMSKDVPEPLTLENLQLQVTATPPDTRYNVIFENFIPENFVPKEKPLPLSSVLTMRPKKLDEKTLNTEKMLPLLDGRVYVPDNLRFQPQEKWIKTDLKWSSRENLPFNELFLKHLALHITALAAKAKVSEIQWCLSYPSAFSKGDRNHYAKVWQDVIGELVKTTGIEHKYPEIDSEHFRTESLAVAQYFADFEDNDLVYTTCIDLGGGTSDISIWEANSLLHQCSVQLAGRDIFSQFLEMNPGFIERRLGEKPEKWKGLKGGSFNAKLDVWLRLESDNWLNNQRPLLQEEEDLQGLTKLTAIGIAGLYYYVGILLKVLHTEGKYHRGQITPVYIGGNGSRFLKWLDDRGKFDRNSEVNELLSRMLSVGSGFEDTEQLTRLSNNPKDEAACGLVLSSTRLKGMGKKAKDPLIAGEACRLKTVAQGNGEEKIEEIGSYSRLEVTGDGDCDVVDLEIPDLVELPKFLYEFHKALRDLEIEVILPLKNYVRSPEREKNQKLWEDTRRELDNFLLQVKGDSANIRFEPPFISGLKALLRVLGKRWAGK
jgi:hypothetical protein